MPKPQQQYLPVHPSCRLQQLPDLSFKGWDVKESGVYHDACHVAPGMQKACMAQGGMQGDLRWEWRKVS